MKLEKIANEETNLKDSIYLYMVDVASGWAYYTPTYAAQELLCGKDIETTIKTRAIGLVAGALVARPVGLIRNYVANKMNVTKDSPTIEKIKVNFISVTPIQAIVYAGMLGGGMAWSGNYDLKSSALAWSVGIGVGALHSIPYGYFQDKFRKFFGVNPAIKG